MRQVTTLTVAGWEKYRGQHETLAEAIASLRRLRAAALESCAGDGVARTITLTVEMGETGIVGCSNAIAADDDRGNDMDSCNCVDCGASLHKD